MVEETDVNRHNKQHKKQRDTHVDFGKTISIFLCQKTKKSCFDKTKERKREN